MNESVTYLAAGLEINKLSHLNNKTGGFLLYSKTTYVSILLCFNALYAHSFNPKSSITFFVAVENYYTHTAVTEHKHSFI